MLSKMIPPYAINRVYVPFVFDEPVLYKRPSYIIKRAQRHAMLLSYTCFMPLVQMLDDRATRCHCRTQADCNTVLLRGENVSTRIRFSRVEDCSDDKGALRLVLSLHLH